MTFNQKSLLVALIICISILFIHSVHVNFYRIEPHGDMSVSLFSSYINFSQHGNYSIDMELFRSRESSDVMFIMCTIRAEPGSEFYPFNRSMSRRVSRPEGTFDIEGGRVIFWQRIQSEKLREIWFESVDDLRLLVDIYWIDDETVSINGIALNIYRGMYDFRRHMRH